MKNLLNPMCWIGLVLLVPTTYSDRYAPCYYPTGKRANGFYACDATAYITSCCPQGYTCYSNSMCLVTTETESYPNLTIGTALRGACTNPLWNNAVCGEKCLDDAYSKGELQYCGNGYFCCAPDSVDTPCDCEADSTFAFGEGRAQTIVGITESPPTQLPSKYFTGSQTSPLETTTPTTTAIPTTPTMTALPTTQTRQFKIGIGVGLGGGLGIFVIAAILYYWWYYRGNRASAQQQEEDHESPRFVPPNGDAYVNLHDRASSEMSGTRLSRTQYMPNPPANDPYHNPHDHSPSP